jgi:hypothetical protein
MLQQVRDIGAIFTVDQELGAAFFELLQRFRCVDMGTMYVCFRRLSPLLPRESPGFPATLTIAQSDDQVT